MVFTAGTTLVLSPKESIELVWGSAVRVYNYFSKTGLQPAAAMYMANFSIIGGESLGWRKSLQSFSSLRVQNGFSLGNLQLGYPGKNSLPDLLETEFGCRWLGLLAVTCTMPDDYTGARCMENFLHRVASDATSRYLLRVEQCQRLWDFGREIFIGSPYWYKILSITSECAQDQDTDIVTSVFPKAYGDGWLSSFMTAACRLWELAQESKASSIKLYARGFTGSAQLIFYLTAVCGFRVELQGNSQKKEFGDNRQHVTVVVTILHGSLNSGSEEWVTGYLFENMTLECTSSQLVKGTDWKPKHVTYTEPHTSMYCIDMSPITATTGTVLLTQLNAIKAQLAGTGAEPYVSRWMADNIHELAHQTFLKSVEQLGVEARQSRPRRLHRQCQILSERVRTAVEVLVPGLIQSDHLEEVLSRISTDTKPLGPVLSLKTTIPMETWSMLCPCHAHGNRLGVNMQGPTALMVQGHCMQITQDLQELASRIYLCSSISINAQVLRDIGPDYQWKGFAYSMDRPRGSFCYGYSETSLSERLEAVATRVAGRQIRADDKDDDVVALAAGGFVVGVEGNEEMDILDDCGHSIYIIPGSIETEERHFDEVYLSRSATTSPRYFDESLKNIPPISDLFGPSKLVHNVHPMRDCAVLSTDVVFETGRVPLMALAAIDKSASLRVFRGCLGECAAGQLTESEMSKVQLCTPKNVYTDCDPRPGLRYMLKKHLQIALALGNTLVQRAIISRVRIEEKIMLLAGSCIHCAIRAALIEEMDVLIC